MDAPGQERSRAPQGMMHTILQKASAEYEQVIARPYPLCPIARHLLRTTATLSRTTSP